MPPPTPLRPIAVIATAGHVDHGKTALVRALTGMETDRLPEEQARGISIELGFAWLDLPTSGRVAFIDVPGHERFVRQMIAGAAGIDAVVLVVAADEGVMPQTREHLDICRLLDVRDGLVVLSRCDLVDPAFLELVRDDVADLVRGTALSHAEVVPFSIHEPVTREAVLAALSRLVARTARGAARDRDRPFVLAVDRAFTRPGFGTIVTGTSRAGVLALEDEVLLHAPGQASMRARVRGLEVHGEAVSSVEPGARVAVNLGGVSVADAPRGARIVHAGPGAPVPCSIWDVRVEALARLPIAVPHLEKGLACFGASVTEATLALVDRDELAPGEVALGQLRLSEPLALLPGERWVFRGFRAFEAVGATLGGGTVIAPAPRKRKHGSPSDEIEVLAGADIAAAVSAFVASHGEAGVRRVSLHASLPFARAALDAAVAVSDLIASDAGPLATLVSRRALASLHTAIASELQAAHEARPAAPGLGLDELRTRVRPDAEPALFAAIVSALEREGRLVRRGPALALAGFEPHTSKAEDRLDQALLAALERADLTPPRTDELAATLGADGVSATPPAIEQAIQRLVAAGKAARVQKDLVLSRAALDRLERRVRDHFARNEWLDAQALKDLTGASRKWAIPLGEWLDRARVTLRVGDRRRLLK